MLQVRKKLLLLPLVLMISQLSFAQESSELLYSESLKALDSLVVNSFRSASNSTDFLIIRKEDQASLKDYVSSLDRVLGSAFYEDSIKIIKSQFVIDSLNTEVSILRQQIEAIPEPIAMSDGLNFYQVFSIVTLVIIIFLSIKLITQSRYIDSIQDAFIEIENTFQAHKRKSIEKERKIKRELIDANLRLEELENQLKLLNHSD